ncbi:MAG: response regulator [Ignavibacteria bacterium]|nr:response regulator [Ignavibacteria bacterium]
MKIPDRIIVLDDDSINNMFCRYIIKEALEEKSEIVMFTSPQKALIYINAEYAINGISTVLFLDINMPVLSGWDVLDELSKTSSAVKENITVYMLSSSVDPNDKKRADKFDMVNGFYEKPLTVEAVQDICNMN